MFKCSDKTFHMNSLTVEFTFRFLFSDKMMVWRAGIHKILVKMPNREDPDQTASDLGLFCLSRPFWQETSVKKFIEFTVYMYNSIFLFFSKKILLPFLQAESQVMGERSRLLELLESEKQKAAQKVEELKQRRNDLTSRKTLAFTTTEVSTAKMDLYRIALQIREANKISQYLKKHMVSIACSCDDNSYYK